MLTLPEAEQAGCRGSAAPQKAKTEDDEGKLEDARGLMGLSS